MREGLPSYGLNSEFRDVRIEDGVLLPNYRLPTEAEWEYAAKARRDFKYSGSEEPDEVAWYKSNSGQKTHPVAMKKPNAWGICDMSGNVWEWCADDDELARTKVIHGGAFYRDKEGVGAAARDGSSEYIRNYFLGVRVVVVSISLGAGS